MDAKVPVINLGATVSEKLKTIYFPDEPWVECYKKVAIKFTEFKKMMRKFYSDKTDNEMLIEINRYSEQDILDAFDNI